jgi:hypothetical protein
MEKRSVVGVERAILIRRDDKDLRVRDVFYDKGPGPDQAASLQEAGYEERPFAAQQVEQAWPVVLRKVGQQPYRDRRYGASRQERLTRAMATRAGNPAGRRLSGGSVKDRTKGEHYDQQP